MWTVIVPAVAGLISGAIGSLIAPWALWGIEKRRKRNEARAAMISAARSALAEPPFNQEFRLLPIYSQLKPFLSARSVDAIEPKPLDNVHTKQIAIVMGDGRHSGVNPYAQRVLDEISELEQKWGLL